MDVDNVLLSLFRDEEGGERVELSESENNDSQENDVERLRVAFYVRRRRRRLNQPLFAKKAENLLLPVLEDGR